MFKFLNSYYNLLHCEQVKSHSVDIFINKSLLLFIIIIIKKTCPNVI